MAEKENNQAPQAVAEPEQDESAKGLTPEQMRIRGWMKLSRT